MNRQQLTKGPQKPSRLLMFKNFLTKVKSHLNAWYVSLYIINQKMLFDWYVLIPLLLSKLQGMCLTNFWYRETLLSRVGTKTYALLSK